MEECSSSGTGSLGHLKRKEHPRHLRPSPRPPPGKELVLVVIIALVSVLVVVVVVVEVVVVAAQAGPVCTAWTTAVSL